MQLMIFLIIDIARPSDNKIPIPPVLSYNLVLKGLNILVHFTQLSFSFKFFIQKLLDSFFLIKRSLRYHWERFVAVKRSIWEISSIAMN